MDEVFGKRPGSEVLASEVPSSLPVLPARDLVPFPSIMMALYVERHLAEQVMADNETGSLALVLVVAQRNGLVSDPEPSDLYRVGIVSQVLRTIKLPDERVKILLKGLFRAKLGTVKKDGILRAGLKVLPPRRASKGSVPLLARIRENLQVLVEREHIPEEILLLTDEAGDLSSLADGLLAHYRLDIPRAQAALEELDPTVRLKIADSVIADDLNQLLVSEKIADRTRIELNRGQREYYLREQIKQIQEELGEVDATAQEVAQLKERLNALKLAKETRTEVDRQLARLERIPPESTEHALLRTYLEWVVDLPWSSRSRDKYDPKEAKKILDRDHFGLDKAKERILEYLAVRKLQKNSRGPIVCFVGPPGVGKTSLARAIAEALGRKCIRMSLGGVRDEAEIRGHRRTYVGALPGRILQGMKQAGTRNPVFVLDELDKVGNDFRGDPASALLEVLDPHQNTDFRDHYLNLSFDLSEVLFIATANTIDTIPEALVDRLETIFIAGYTVEEKEKIAKRFIIPRQINENGLAEKGLSINEDAIKFIIERYTAEAGVRNLEREIASLCRKVARQFVEHERVVHRVTLNSIPKLLGPTKVDPEARDSRDLVGLARGLAWTVNGGEMMPVEVSIAKGSGNLALTGQLGSIMQESAQAAVFYARANAEALGLSPSFYQKFDVHVHVPSGATPKDGPSAGITIACALVSVLSGRKVSSKIAMTGEITLRGNVLAVGGLKEKALAALRSGIDTVIVPYENLKDLEEIPKEQRSKITFHPVRYISEVLDLALLPKDKSTRAPSSAPSRAKPKRKKRVDSRREVAL